MFDINYAEIFQSIPPQLATALIAMVPIAELRVSIPVALGVYELPVWQAIFFSVIADIIVAAIVIYFLGALHEFLYGKYKWINRIFDWVFERTRQKFFKKYETWGNIALMLFVAIPLPITGAWTASVASWMFGINKKKALFFISLGVIISACIVTLISLGFIKVF
ncbi:MAG: small multi-drug export protein [Candidatus Falkowbacteria bacterium]|nr:small multi-drug export protein [Candidatus Parcubacteria bacterium]